MSQVQLKIKKPNYFGGQQQKDTPLSLPSAWMWTASPLRPGPHTHNPCSLMRNSPEPRGEEAKWLEMPPLGASLWPVCGVWPAGFENLLYSVLENCTADFIILSQCPSKMHGERDSSASPCATRGRRGGKLGSPAALTASLLLLYARWQHVRTSSLNYPNPVSQQPNYVPEGKSYLRDRKGLHVRRY